MRKTACFVVLLLCCATPLFAQAQSSGMSSEASTSISKVLDRGLSSVEEEFVGAADAMPEEKYHFAPTNGEFKGVRDFATQVKHVAAVNNLVSSSMLGEKLPADSGRENGPDKIKTKNDILKYLRDSFARAHRAIAAVNKENAVTPIKDPFGDSEPATRLGLSTLIISHCFDHYGQMVEYLRMNGIIPPASRR